MHPEHEEPRGLCSNGSYVESSEGVYVGSQESERGMST